MRFSDIYKKGYGKPDTTDIIVGGMAIDIKDKKVYSHAEDGTVFQVGLNEEQVNGIIADLALLPPIGSIIMYAGQLSNLSINWAVCNGSGGTPDLRNKFVYGTNVQSEINTSGGSADAVNVTHKHTSPKHTHTANSGDAGKHTHKYDQRAYITNYDGDYSGSDQMVSRGTSAKNTTEAPDHKHTVTVNNTTSTVNNSGESGTGKNIPPYIKLAYIMRMS